MAEGGGERMSGWVLRGGGGYPNLWDLGVEEPAPIIRGQWSFPPNTVWDRLSPAARDFVSCCLRRAPPSFLPSGQQAGGRGGGEEIFNQQNSAEQNLVA